MIKNFFKINKDTYYKNYYIQIIYKTLSNKEFNIICYIKDCSIKEDFLYIYEYMICDFDYLKELRVSFLLSRKKLKDLTIPLEWIDNLLLQENNNYVFKLR